jgi:hypothetical protein
MGTNFYTIDDIHIGKRSAAGLYCFDCEVTLCKNGEDAIHQGSSGWYNTCPKCGKVGLDTCTSFTWAIDPVDIMTTKAFKDEYDRLYSLTEMITILQRCPIHFYAAIGESFS